MMRPMTYALVAIVAFATLAGCSTTGEHQTMELSKNLTVHRVHWGDPANRFDGNKDATFYHEIKDDDGRVIQIGNHYNRTKPGVGLIVVDNVTRTLLPSVGQYLSENRRSEAIEKSGGTGTVVLSEENNAFDLNFELAPCSGPDC